MNDTKIERLADESFAEFKSKWTSVKNWQSEIGEPLPIEIWHHAFRAGIASASYLPPEAEDRR